MLQNFIVLSSDAEHIKLLSEEKQTDRTVCEWPFRITEVGLAVFCHSLIVLSEDAEAIESPSGENYASLTFEVWPISRVGCLFEFKFQICTVESSELDRNCLELGFMWTDVILPRWPWRTLNGLG
mmetsp:Transcript_31536/g.5695  ORF Transcript_31536/g.5695 Transcript_31536/m.5695 type:complete len:125 (+) Transcript_31536:826-1200(+)